MGGLRYKTLFLSAEDRESVGCVVHKVCVLQEQVVLEGDVELQGKISSFMEGLVMLIQLVITFRQTPRGKICGRGGVAEKLG